MRAITLLVLCPSLLACESSDPAYIPYVPGPGFTQILEISLELPDSAPVPVGEWVTMHATRESGPWVLQDSTMTDDPPCKEVAPVTEEYEAANKVSWTVEPSEDVEFRATNPPERLRQVRFNKPGRYRVRAESRGCGEPFQSNVVEVVVR